MKRYIMQALQPVSLNKLHVCHAFEVRQMKEIKIKLAIILTASMVLNPFIPAYAGEIVELEEPVVQQ